MDNVNINAITEAEIDALLGETKHTSTYHANHLITDKIIDPKSPNFGKKGESYMLMTNGAEQWYFKPKGEEDFIRVKWYQLDSNVSDGTYGEARYKGMNPSINGKIGELFYTGKKWMFHFEDEKYQLVNPDSVIML
jgi:hypothetical protein